MADQGNESALRRDPVAGEQGRDGELLPGFVHAVGARGDGTPLGGGAPAGAGAAVPRDRGTNRRLDDDGDAGGPLAASRRRWLPASARSRDVLSRRLDGGELMRVAVPVKGRLREPSFHLLEDAGLGPEQPGDRALAF